MTKLTNEKISTGEFKSCKLCRMVCLKPNFYNADGLCKECEVFIHQAEIKARIDEANYLLNFKTTWDESISDGCYECASNQIITERIKELEKEEL